MNDVTASFLTFFHCSLCFSLLPASSAALDLVAKNVECVRHFDLRLLDATQYRGLNRDRRPDVADRRHPSQDVVERKIRDLISWLISESEGLRAGPRHLIDGERLRVVAISEECSPKRAVRLFKQIALRASLGEIVCFERVADKRRTVVQVLDRPRNTSPVVIETVAQEQKAVLLPLPYHRLVSGMCHKMYPILYHNFSRSRVCSQKIF